MTSYQEFLKTKSTEARFDGIPESSIQINPKLYEFQRDITRWALLRGRACIFADCGLGKTFMQLSWAANIPGDVLILAPLGVTEQTVEEGKKIGVKVKYCRHADEVEPGITITNYEMLEHFDLSRFKGVALDESSILKHYEGKFRNLIITSFRQTPYRLACTATPAPNDYMELGNHAEFVGAMSRTEMLSMFFVHDGGETSKWRLKGHAQAEFWRWVCSWAVMIRKPSDLGYKDEGFILPPLRTTEVIVESKPLDGFLFPMQAATLQERISARRESVQDRAKMCADIVNKSDESWIIWCNLNSESDELESLIGGAVQLRGSDDIEDKRSKLMGFANGTIKKLVTKPSIAGHGMNFQVCHNQAFVGLSDSWEEYYQAVRRCWRFGQTKPVDVSIIVAESEGAVLANIKRKEADAVKMAEEMVNNMHELNQENLKGTKRTMNEYKQDVATGEGWKVLMSDCVDASRFIESDSIDFSIFSPPFASLYTYSASDRDMGNCKDDAEFFEHFKFLIKELFRVMKPGRNLSFHCMNLPTSKSHHGVIGIRDFRGELIRAFEAEGFIFHSEVCIWKDPVTAMQRTKALGLLWKQIKKDSAMSRQGIPDYLVTMRKPGVNDSPVSHTADEFPVDQWQRWASPVWMDINPSDTLQFRSAREHNDERHICPLQLEVIRRAIMLWSNPGDLVLSPFAGIGSEGVVAIETGRKFIGIELKESYWKQAKANLGLARAESKTLFDFTNPKVSSHDLTEPEPTEQMI